MPVDTAAKFDRRAIPAAAVERHWEAADGTRLRRIDWQPQGRDDGADEPPRGSILFLPGRGDHYEKYLETLDQWSREGWYVTASDWRGQGTSKRLGRDPHTGHIEDFGIWTRDLSSLWDTWQAETPGPHVLIGHSMGGHLVLRALVEKRVDPDAVVLSAPMLGLVGTPGPLWLLGPLSKGIARLGDPRRPAWKSSEKPGALPEDRGALLTHDPDRYADELWWRDERPEVAMGPASWGWVAAAIESMRTIEAKGALETVETPVLLFGTTNDQLVAWNAIERAGQRLPYGEVLEFGDEAHHEIFREADRVRTRAMDGIADFLDRKALRNT
ncbi:alpha/beta hydrolase [Citromicrobium bathyomarinum]|uniref:alpha/beta hydrolase n=1 Tax=Sphingomonadales TaxID=204457 RepID=UPI000C6B16B9|nr:lysophospholipase [Citromicrobium sp.]|tara:strand:+ start:451 stop:1434 length:984 start_codon:yes stop_codon:yes gene_type:complete